MRWIFDVFASPNPDFFWLNPKGYEIAHVELEKYKLQINYSLNKYTLEINDLKLTDMGHYILQIVVTNENDPESTTLTKNVDLYLKIFKDPEVALHPINVGQSYFIANQNTEFKVWCIKNETNLL